MEKPKIRFKGYQEDWEQRKFGDYNDLMTGYPFESDKFSEDGIKLVRGMNVKRGYLDFSEDICVKWNSCVGLENFLLKDGDILIQMDGALIGKSYAKIKENQLPALLVQRVTRARTNNKFASQDFMYQIIQRDFLRYIEMNKTETAVPHLSLNDIRNFEIMVPCLAEQKKIGDYFESLDHLITLHQRKCEEMKILKKYMLQKMFPQNGQLVPQIRFSGFTEDWEQRKLDDVVEFLDTMRKPLEGAKRISGPYPYYGASGIVDYVDGYLFDEELILLSEDGANITDRNYPVCFLASGKYWVNNHAHVLRTKQENENNFICNSLERKDYTQYNTGMAMPKLNKETCKKIPILCPGFEEQKKIGDYFRSLDNLITLHQQKCDELRNIKKFMLQNMFI